MNIRHKEERAIHKYIYRKWLASPKLPKAISAENQRWKKYIIIWKKKKKAQTKRAAREQQTAYQRWPHTVVQLEVLGEDFRRVRQQNPYCSVKTSVLKPEDWRSLSLTVQAELGQPSKPPPGRGPSSNTNQYSAKRSQHVCACRVLEKPQVLHPSLVL